MSASEAIARLRELRAKATAGPWERSDSTAWVGTYDNRGEPVQERLAETDNAADAAAIVAAMNSLPALLECASQLEKLTEAASCIRHWHDAMADGSGMVVSAEHVRKLWDATEQARAALQALAEGGGE
jgi:hypothetical protein